MLSLVLASVLGFGPTLPTVCTPGDFWWQDNTKLWFSCPVRNVWHVDGSAPGLSRTDPFNGPTGLLDHIPAPPPPGVSISTTRVLQSDLTWGAGGSGAPATAQYVTGVDDAGLSADIFPSADDQIPLSNGATAVWTAVPNCLDSNGQHLNYRSATNAFSCGTSLAGAEVEVDFGAAGNTNASTVVVGQTWVTALSQIACAPTLVATADRAEGAEDAIVEGLTVAIHSRVVGTGWTVSAAVLNGVAFGKFRVHCVGQM